MRFTVSFITLVSVSLVSVGSISARQTHSAKTLRHLLVRQVPGVNFNALPAECQNQQCSNTVNNLHLRCDSLNDCGCSSSDISDAQSCFDCLANVAITPDLKDGFEQDASTYESNCQKLIDASTQPAFSGSSVSGTLTAESGSSSQSQSAQSTSSNSGDISGATTATSPTPSSGGNNSDGAVNIGANIVSLTLVTVFGGLLAL
ncbi:hypothetical protein K435DRAFT_872724 [Dendrothele bispora CBS 962.96]|uniref:Extracellular membrane protein CFEM domain-containing protein n=1 Tax=Dendrothele bispora (strain CBS 962.96) TaxID=1314807 RepID=A0A4V4HC68_DENBC|nr:hypothetical protein K435DRAFT_872724 [Dendrothele bispora CBS 962.96]